MRIVRNNSRPVYLRDDGEGGGIVGGYAAVFYREGDESTEFYLWDEFVERIMPGAFDAAMAEGDDVRGLFNHDSNYLLGRTKSNTLRLSVDDVGLRYEMDLPDTQAGRDLRVSLERGDIDGSSFAFSFRPQGERITRSAGQPTVREVLSVQLYDVGPVTFPAYAGTTSGIRSQEVDELRRQEQEQLQKTLADKRRRERRMRIIDIA